MMKTKFKVGIPYTVWIDVEAESRDEATSIAVNTDYGLNCNELAQVELNEFDEVVVYTHQALGIE